MGLEEPQRGAEEVSLGEAMERAVAAGRRRRRKAKPEDGDGDGG